MNEIHPWEKTYSENAFKIITNNPSLLIKKYKNKFRSGDNILDVGCGNGRNSVFLSSIGCNVDCFDVADLQWINGLSKELKDRIFFSKSLIQDFKYKNNKYNSIIITRVLQYLNKIDLINLLDNVFTSLKDNGFILISFSSSGGIFNKKEIKLPKYKYSIGEIMGLLEDKFKKVVVNKGAKISSGVNYKEGVDSYDIIASIKK